jgi:hypothetical protein
MATERMPAQLSEAEQALAMPASDEEWRHPREGAAVRPVHWGRVRMVDLTPGAMRLCSSSPRDGALEIEIPDGLGHVLKMVLDEPVEVRYDEYRQDDGSVRLVACALDVLPAEQASLAELPAPPTREELANEHGFDPDASRPDWGALLQDVPESAEQAQAIAEELLEIHASRQRP